MNANRPQQLIDLSTSESYSRHQKQRFWQIIAPVAIGTLLILVVFTLVIVTAVGTEAGGSVSQWADTSLIWLSLPVMLFALILALILLAMIWLLARLLKILPHYTLAARYYAGLIFGYITSGADKLVTPIIRVKGFGATVSGLMNALLGRRRG